MSANDNVFYFCYGSNLWSKRLNCKSAIKYGNGFLKDWKLDFSGKSQWNGPSGDLIPQKGNIVWGTVFSISGTDLERLYSQEGSGYEWKHIDITIDGTEEVVNCYTLVQKNEHKLVDLESKITLTYKSVIIKGAIEQQLPEEYIEFLKTIPDNGVLDSGAPGLEL